VRKFVRDNGLGLFFGAIFLLALFFQAVAGHADYNSDQLAHGGEAISFGRYLTSSSFGNAVMENWQSEYLQFTLFILMTVFLIQRGSPESKEPDAAGSEGDREQRIGRYAGKDSPLMARVGGVGTFLYSNSLVIAMGLIFLASLFAQSVTGWTDYNDEQSDHHEPAVSWISYLGTARFWEATLQNWQSEFLAVGSMAVLAIYLRQRGSPESKPVGAPHDKTAATG
jgi:uncharacterized protein DUF6766